MVFCTFFYSMNTDDSYKDFMFSILDNLKNVEDTMRKLKIPVKISLVQKKVYSFLVNRSLEDLRRIPAG